MEIIEASWDTCDVCNGSRQEEPLVDFIHQASHYVCCVVDLLLHCEEQQVLRMCSLWDS